MYNQLDSMQSAVDAVQDIPVFGYKETALNNNEGIPGHNNYSDNNDNNIPLVDGTGLNLQEMEKGFRDSISTLSRSFFTHFFGRSSFNTNRLKSLFSDVLETYKVDYAHNFRAWDNTAIYAENDVCFLVAYGIRYCFKSLVDNNTDPISADADGTLDYDDTKWVLLTEQRTVSYPIGKPFLWFGGTLPDNYICFSDGQQYNWNSYPELNTAEFRALLTRFTFKGAKADSTTFTVPSISELYPISVETLPDALSVVGAKVPAHYHSLSSGTVNTSSTTNTDHTHSIKSSADAGSHRHYTGDYQSSQTSVDTDNAWHEDSKFQGEFTWQGTGQSDNEYEDYRVYLTPQLEAAKFSNHSVSVPAKTLAHTHSGTVTPSGSGNFSTASGKYRPGTVKTVLMVRAS